MFFNVTLNKSYFHSLHKRLKCTLNKHGELNFCHKFYPSGSLGRVKYLIMGIESYVLMLVSQLFKLANNCLVHYNH